MRRLILLLALLTLPAMPAQAQVAREARVTQVDTSRYPEISIYVRVTDGANQLVPNLAQNDFSITEDDQPVALNGFVGGGASSVSTVLVVDRSGSMEEGDKMEGARDAARTFVEQMRSGDRTSLLAFNSSNEPLQAFTSDQSALNKAIRKLKPDGGTALYDALVAGVDQLDGAPGRRVLLALTDGQDCRDSSSCPAHAGSTRSLDDAISYASTRGQSVYIVGLGERGSDADEGINETALQRIASGTNGEYFYAPDGATLSELYRKLAGEVQQEYRLTYLSPRPNYDGTRRDIRVNVGGATEASGDYLERHMIDVRSSPLVAALLLLPLAAAFVAPTLLRRRRAEAVAPAMQSVPIIEADEHAGPHVTVLSSNDLRCQQCSSAVRPGARFCSNCGNRVLKY